MRVVTMNRETAFIILAWSLFSPPQSLPFILALILCRASIAAGVAFVSPFLSRVLQEAGRRMADVVSSDKFATSGAYWRWNGQDAEATARENVVSDEAMDEARCERLWKISSDLVGI